MTTTDIKAKLHEEIESGDERLLKMLYALIKEYKDDSNGERISIEQYNKEIDEAVARVKAGKFYTQEEVEKMAKDW